MPTRAVPARAFQSLPLLAAVWLAAAFFTSAPTAAGEPEQAGPVVGRALRDPRACEATGGSGSRLPGETVENAIGLGSYPPFWVEGNTCEYADDYDEVCPYAGSTSPDVVYAFQPLWDEVLHVDLCQSSYDTKVYIYVDAVTPGDAYACNDDACGDDGWKSELEYVQFYAGHTYYIIVDGYGGNCGAYALNIDYTWLCVFCSEEALWEAEPECHDGYEDLYDGGCDSDPPAFVRLEPSEEAAIELCGTTGTYLHEGEHRRDTDWYEITLTAPRSICWDAWCNEPFDIFLLDGREGCEDPPVLAADNGPYGCDILEIVVDLDPGTYWLKARPHEVAGIPCGTEYQSLLYGYTPDPGAAVVAGETRGPGPKLVVERQPAAGDAALRLTLPQPGPVTLEILDASGRRVERLLDGAHLEAGVHALSWRAAGAASREESGLYFCRLRTAQGEVTRSLVRLR